MFITRKRIAGLMLMATLIGTEGFAQTTAKKSTASPLARPKLVVGIVVDQMRYDYLYRYYDKYGEGGFKRLMNEGYNCRNNHYSYALTVTAAGHASVYTGSIPAINGIVGNNWYDNLAGKDMYCAEDPSVETVGSTNATAGKMSPRNLLSTTITDQLQIATNFRSKTVGVAIKDRGAILPAGHTASGAYWFDSKTGNWITSTFYTKELPQWVQDVNARKLPSEYMKKGWNTLLPINQYEESTGDDQPYETRLSGAATSTFPYDLAGRSGDAFGIIASTPWGNTMTKEMAMAAIKGENMGKGSQTDFLAVSFSSPDYVGHAFGPNSIEIEDVYLRLDQEFAEFFAFLDSWTGKGNYTVFLTADHGVMDIPAFWTEHRLPAGLLDNSKIKNAMATAIKEEFGEGEFVKANENYQIYFDHKTLKSKGIEVEDLYDVVREVLLPIPGIADVVNLKDLGETHLNSYQLELYKNGTHATRSGDLQIVTQPGWISGRGVGTTHGSPYNYDTHVPLLFYGWGVNKGETLRRTAIADIAPTLAGILRILPPNGSVGEPVLEAVKK